MTARHLRIDVGPKELARPGGYRQSLHEAQKTYQRALKNLNLVIYAMGTRITSSRNPRRK